MKPSGPTNPVLGNIIFELRKSKKYPDLLKAIVKPRRKKKSFNLSELDSMLKDEKKIATTEVLGKGELTKPVWIYAARFSASAKEKIEKAGGKHFTLDHLLKEKDNIKVIV